MLPKRKKSLPNGYLTTKETNNALSTAQVIYLMDNVFNFFNNWGWHFSYNLHSVLDVWRKHVWEFSLSSVKAYYTDNFLPYLTTSKSSSLKRDNCLYMETSLKWTVGLYSLSSIICLDIL